MYLHRLRRYFGAFLVQLGGQVDAIVFSAGMGENSSILRGRALQGLEVCFNGIAKYFHCLQLLSALSGLLL